jgi:hypothetical protein
METTKGPSGAVEELTVGTSSIRNDDDPAPEVEERREEAFEATIVRLDPKAAEKLFQLAGL